MPTPLSEWGWQACRDTRRARDTCILWEQSRLDPRSLQIPSREKYDSFKVSCIFKKFSLIVYSLGYSFVVHTPKLGRRPCLSPSTSSAHIVCAFSFHSHVLEIVIEIHASSLLFSSLDFPRCRSCKPEFPHLSQHFFMQCEQPMLCVCFTEHCSRCYSSF